MVFGHDMTSEAALTKLSYLLGRTELSTQDVSDQLSISLHGELTGSTQMKFEHPNGHLPQHLSDLTALSYVIAKGNLAELQGLLKADDEWLLNQADYSGNTPLVSSKIPTRALLGSQRIQHIAATGPSLEILRSLLSRGASVHLRNSAGRTPLFLATNAGLIDHVMLLRDSGAHLHADEINTARLHARHEPSIWHAAGV